MHLFADEDEDMWEVRVSVPAGLSPEMRDSLFDVIADAVESWEPADRDGWDANVSAGPVQN